MNSSANNTALDLTALQKRAAMKIAALAYLDKAKEYYSDHQWDYDEFMHRLDDEDSGPCRLISNIVTKL